ncbi:hypothetical protein JJC00_02810 [Bradyrhizobium diazoefficiens]|uniref:hypothetical protein n=1 Tax=Bradyrhizobium diazoefficiens TaxID=1355477 RepID=UPI00190CEA59|nr:hypothetical protein [Bradyrhizobium diazoefficiens]QQO34653.1 hypothetical protein JJC00_02810 [Bradyrhizobium diazoefficiens]
MNYALTELDLDACAALGVGGSPLPRSLDNPFHGPVNFILRANTDIEAKFAVRPREAAVVGKSRARHRAGFATGKRADNSGMTCAKKSRQNGEICTVRAN